VNRLAGAVLTVIVLAALPAVTAAAPKLSPLVLPLTEATALNDRGQVAGYAHLGTVDEHHAYLWQDGILTDLGNLAPASADPRAIFTVPGDLNNRGQVVGSSETAEGTEPHAFLWQDGKMSDLGTLWGIASSATAINERGQVVGSAAINAVPDLQHAILWDDGLIIDLGTLGGSESWAADINNQGQIVGASDLPSDPHTRVRHAVLWEGGVMTDLGALGGVGSEAYAINDRGQVIGRIEMASGPAHAFLWEAGTMIDLGAFVLEGINERGQAVGYSPEGAPIRWQAGVVTELEMPAAALEGRAREINARGEIVGTVFELHDVRGSLWTK
jgi:probable HAF family extracellular repeat protein